MINYDLSRVPPVWLTPPHLHPGRQFPVALYRPVLALTLTRGTQVLACVRNPENNKTHPGVLSVPTMRLRSANNEGFQEGLAGLLPRKLGNPGFLKPINAMDWQGHSVVGSDAGQPVTYPLTMINAHVRLGLLDTDLTFPAATEAYSWIGWVEQEAFIEAVEKRDTFPLDVPELDCDTIIYGMCCQSTKAMLESL